MFRVLFLVLICSVTFLQAQKREEGYIFFEYDKISDQLLKEKSQSFCAEINKTGWVGFFVIYGSSEETEKSERQIKKSMENRDCRKEYPEPRMVFVRGGKKDKPKTVFWLVPPGKQPPLE